MVEANEDATAVTMKIRRETRVAKEQAMAERAAEAASGELRLPPPVPGTPQAQTAAAEATVAVPPPSSSGGPVDAEAAFRRARLGVVAVVVLVLLLAWVVQRRRSCG